MKSEAQRLMDEYDAAHGAACSRCSKPLVPLKSGKARTHNRNVAVGTFWRTERCPGSGLAVRPSKPSPTTPTEGT